MHEKLVIGAALRRTGDLEAARDVAQEVFAGLARKARQLTDRECLAGWLYRAASYEAARVVQSSARREIRHRRLIEDQKGGVATNSEGEHWAVLEEAMAALNAAEQEAIAMHYFQDLSYAEMAARLGLSEVAARKRVSRAVSQLGRMLGRRKVSTPATAVLTAAVGIQVTIPAQAGLAQAALASAAVSGAAPLLSLPIFMSHTSFKIMAASVAIASVPLIAQVVANESLRARLERQRAASDAGQSVSLPQSSDFARMAALQKELDDLSQKVSTQRRLREAGEARVRELEQQQSQVERGEVVVSIGEVEAAAHRMGEFVRSALRFEREHPEGPAATAQQDAQLSSLFNKVGDIMMEAEVVKKLERDPAKVAHFYARLAAESLNLDPATLTTAETTLSEKFDALRSSGLSYPQRPAEDASQWDQRRQATLRSLMTDFGAQVPEAPGKAEFFDLLTSGIMFDLDESNPIKKTAAP